MPTKKVVKKKLSIVRSFRLLDFHIYDESNKKDSDSGSDGETNKYSNEDDNMFVIQMFGVDEKGKTCCLYINDYQPFFFVKINDDWSQYMVNSMVGYLKDTVAGRYKNSLVSFKIVEHSKLYGFSGGKKHKFVKLTFKNSTAMNKYKNIWYDYVKDKKDSSKSIKMKKNIVFDKVSLELYESNIPPLLRYFHIYNISPSGWISFNSSKMTEIPTKTTTCNFEYTCSLKNLEPLPEKETAVPYKICSFDIEASSSHGDFPVPIKTYKRLATNIVDVFIKQQRIQSLSEEQCKEFLKRCLLCGFNYGSMEDIDLVYPKLPPSKPKVLSLIEKLLTKTLENAKKDTDEDNSDLLQIDSLFEAMKDSHQNNIEGSAEANGEEIDNSLEYTNYSKKKETKIKLKKSTKITDVLFSDQYTRDEQITILDEVLTLLFPRLKGDEVTFIGSTFMKYGSKEPYLNHCLVVGSCDDVEGAEIECVKTEEEILTKWTELIQQENPDIIIGYNIFGFDYEFMFRRAQENYCDREFLMLSRKVNEICANEERDSPGKYNLEHTKIQIASGEYDLRYAKMSGRLQIDM